MDPDLATGHDRLREDPAALQALRDVAVRPAAFFAELPRTGPLVKASRFALVCIAVSTALAWPAGASDDGLVNGLLIPLVFDLVFFAAYVALTHALVLLLWRRGSSGLPATFKIVAYGQVSQLINWLPEVGLTLGFLYGSVLAVLGLRAMHDAPLRRAVAVVLLPVALAAVAAGAYLLLV
jgi:hypothetical protein